MQLFAESSQTLMLLHCRILQVGHTLGLFQ
jgi:hypothetical protein